MKIILLSLLLGLGISIRGQGITNTSEPYFEIVNADAEFGMIEEGPSYELRFILRNKTADTLFFDYGAIRSNCGCLVGYLNKRIVFPRDTASVLAKFSSAGRIGTFQKSLAVLYKDQRTTIHVKGIVYPKDTGSRVSESRLSLASSELDFGIQKVGAVDSMEIALKNNGRDTIKILQIAAAGWMLRAEVWCKRKGKWLKTTWLLPKESGVLKIHLEKVGKYSDARHTIYLRTNEAVSNIHSVRIRFVVEGE